MSHVSRSYLFKSLLVLFACVVFTLTAFAQSTTDGAIAGVVMDQSRAVVVGAKITARNVDTNMTGSATSDAQGKFRVVRLTPGTYALTIEAANFAPYTEPKVIVEVGKITNLELALAVAGSKETVEVTAEAPTVNTQQQDFNSNVNQESINNLPINGRRWSNFALLTPGAAPADGFGLISFRGISGLMNNSTVDGGDNNQAFFSEERGRTRTNYVVSQSAVREFQVNTSNYSAEYGRAAGAVVNTVTKSGTNSLHGEGFYYIRDNTLGATNAFTTQLAKNPDGTYMQDAKGNYVNAPFKPTDRRQQFGANVGGPIIKDKLFFFFNYDGQRQNIPGVAMPNKPNALFGVAVDSKNNPIPCTDSTTTPASTLFSCAELTTIAKGMTGLSSVTKAQMAAADVAGLSAVNFLAQTTGIQPRTNSQNIYFPKLDWRINQNHTLTMSYNRMRRFSPNDYQTQPVVSYALGDWGDDGVKVDMFNARLSSVLNTSVTNEFRFSYGHEIDFASAGTGSSLYDPLKKGATLYQGYLPDTYFSGTSYNFGLPYTLNRNAYPNEHRQQYANTTTWAHGKHLLKFGGDVTRTYDLMDNLFEAGGDYSYSNRANWITDYTTALMYTADPTVKRTRSYTSLAQSLGKSVWEFPTMEYAFFGQDDFRVLPRLTLNLGVRYEYERLPNPQIGNPALPNTMQLPRDKNNLAPRIGFAYDVFGDGKTAIRGGYGIYYGRFVNSLVANALYATGLTDSNGNPLGQATYSFSNTVGPYYPSIATTVGTTKQNVVYFAPGSQAPQVHQADLVFEQEVAKNTMFSVSYLLSLGRQLTNFRNDNILLPSDTTHNVNEYLYGGPFDGTKMSIPIYTGAMKATTAWGAMADITTNVNSNYNALVAQISRRMTDGLQFQASYTWSHALDAGQNGSVNPPSSGTNIYDPANPGLEYGTSNFDIRHRIVGNVVWQPQYFRKSSSFVKAVLDGWLLAPILTIQSGQPFTEGVNGYPYLPSGWGNAWNGSSLNDSGGTSRLAPILGRNSWRYPWLQNIDLRLSRTFRLTEKQRVEFIAEAFNLFNHMNTTGVYTQMYSMCSSSSTPYCTSSTTNGVDSNGKATVLQNTWIYDPQFGKTTSAGNSVYRERQVQFAVRYSF